MPDVLTRSFCERCGTAYTLGNGPRLPGFASLPVVARGLRNLILSDDSLGDVIAQAREEHAGTLSARQLAAFERTFRFCMECRQYVCRDCWNDARGRCATCAPFPEAVVAPPTPIVRALAVAPSAPAELGIPEPAHAEPLPEPIAAEMLPEPAHAEPLPEPIAAQTDTPAVAQPAPPETLPDPYAWPFAYALPPVPGFGRSVSADRPLTPSATGRAAAAYATCPSCALPVSRAARFCRRCGIPQLEASQPEIVAAPG